MRNLFPGFYKRSEEELSKIWQEGTFVFDTNMLLNVYRYSQKTRDRYLEILDLLKQKNQLWIPFQVAYEYQDRRINVIQGQLDAYTEVSNILQTTWQKLESSLEPYQRKHGFIDAERLTDELFSAIKKAKTTVTQGKEKDKKEFEALKKQDKLLEKLEELFQGNIGNPYNSSKLEGVYKQAQLRVELRIPPGWEDEGKNNFKAYGDIVLWFQLIDYARTQKKPIVFVTDDGKKDWWIQDAKGKPMKPLPALVQEMYVEAGVLLHMYQGYEFLEQAEHFLKLEEKPDIIADAKEVTQQNTLEPYQAKYSASSIARRGYRVENAVHEWIRWVNPDVQLIESPFDSGVDFALTQSEGTKIGIEVKYKSSPFFPVDVRRIIKYLTNRRGADYNKLELILVCESLEDAAQTLVMLREIDVPPILTIMVGFMDGENYFRSFGTFLE